MAHEKDPGPHATANPVPGVAPVNAPASTSVVYVAQPPPHVPPKPNETPPGGKFGLIKIDTADDGQRKETIEYVNANGVPFSEDAEKNLTNVPGKVAK